MVRGQPGGQLEVSKVVSWVRWSVRGQPGGQLG